MTAPLTGVEVRRPHDVGAVLPCGLVTLRNDTGRPLRFPAEAHLLTVVDDPHLRDDDGHRREINLDDLYPRR